MPPVAGFRELASLSTFLFGHYGLANRRKSPVLAANIPVFGRLRLETWFERDCEERVAVNFLAFDDTPAIVEAPDQPACQSVNSGPLDSAAAPEVQEKEGFARGQSAMQ